MLRDIYLNVAATPPRLRRGSERRLSFFRPIDGTTRVGVRCSAVAARWTAAGVLMNLAHFHIIVNHIPSLGSIAGLLLLAAGIYKKDEAIKQFAYQVLVLITIAVLPTYISGAEAQGIVQKS